MKPTLIKMAVVSFALIATPVLAQSQPAATEPTVAATLPNAFEAPQTSATPTAPAAARTPATTPARPATRTAAGSARSETALRAVITDLQSGTVEYGALTNDLAAQVREQADTIGSLLTQFGPLQSMTHKGQPDGADLFEVQFEKQKTEWLIGFDDNNKVAALLFRPAES